MLGGGELTWRRVLESSQRISWFGGSLKGSTREKLEECPASTGQSQAKFPGSSR